MAPRKSMLDKMMTQIQNEFARDFVRQNRRRKKEEAKAKRADRKGSPRRVMQPVPEPTIHDPVAESSGYDFLTIEALIKDGVLQELNRLCLHPQGKELVVLERPDGALYIAGIIDCGDDPEAASFTEGVDKKKVDKVARNIAKHYSSRFKLFGNPVQPVKARRR